MLPANALFLLHQWRLIIDASPFPRARFVDERPIDRFAILRPGRHPSLEVRHQNLINGLRIEVFDFDELVGRLKNRLFARRSYHFDIGLGGATDHLPILVFCLFAIDGRWR